MSAQLLDGKLLSEKLQKKVATRTQEFVLQHGRKPCLVVVLVGEDAASEVYVRNKEKAAQKAGFDSRIYRLPSDVLAQESEKLLTELATDERVDGILLQLPLPKHLNETYLLSLIPATKDIDGFHPENMGKLALGQKSFVPCTPKGCMRILEEYALSVAGKHAVIVGRSNIVGKPVSLLLLKKDATVTICHSKTRDLETICRTADILVAAVGKANFIKADWVKPGAIVLDVGINRLNTGTEKKIVGDVDGDAASVASYLTPVPGGVGPMTIACLLENTLEAAFARASSQK